MRVRLNDRLRIADLRVMPEPDPSNQIEYVVSHVKAAVKDPAGSRRYIEVQTRTISPTQLTLVVQAFFHQDVLELPKVDGSSLRVKGKVSLCQHNRGLLHICLITLDEKLDLSMFMKPTLKAVSSKKGKAAGGDGELEENERASVSVLYIDDQDADRMLMKHQTKDSHIELVSADSPGSACDLLKLGTFDVVVCDFHLEGTTGVELLGKIKPDLYTGPVIFATAETRDSELTKMKSAGADEILTKPLDIKRLSAAIDAVLDENRGSERVGFDPFDAPPSDMALAKSYIPILARLRNEMTRAKSKRNVELAKTVCRSVMGAACGFGFQRLSRTAERAYAAIETANNIDLAGKPVGDFRSQMDVIIEAASPEAAAA